MQSSYLEQKTKQLNQNLLRKFEEAFQKQTHVSSKFIGERRVKSRIGSRVSLFPSVKNQGLICLESNLELAHAIALERNEDVLQYRTQAVQIFINDRHFIIPDFIIKTLNGYEVHEIKPNLLSDFINEKGYSTLGGVLSFVDFISHEYLNKLKNYLRQIRVDKDIYISLMLDGHIFSFFVKWKKSYVKALSGNLIIMSKILTSPAFPVYMLNYRVEDLIYRNLSKIKTKNLKDLNVLQVGAGAIGGYIGDGLSKIGAGLGVGIFDICDNDELKIENIGRHVLGKEFIGMNKALALVDFIKLNLGDNSKLNINYLKNSINEVNNLNTYDVIIDATGQIEVSEYLNERIFTLPIATRPTLLHLWIFGNGECVQALLNEPTLYSGKGGCISCLHQSGNEDYKHLFDPLQNKDYKKVLGLGPCAAYTPYSVSSSLNTAGLAIDIVLEWVNSRSLEYNYFTRYSIGYNGAKISDMFLAAQASCPCCKQKLKINLE